jgi:hypothetical protein
MCPSDGCEATGCVGQRFIDKQPLACGIDTVNGDIGTTFTLTFSVRNSAGLMATVQRVVTITSPCIAGQFYCGGGCTNVDCSTFSAAAAVIPQLQQDLTVPPNLILLPSSSSNWTLTSANVTIYLEYGSPAPFSIAPCSFAANQSASASCAAAALDSVDGDLTPLIKVTDISSIPNQIRYEIQTPF